MTIRLGGTENYWGEEVPLAVDVGQVGIQKGFNWPAELSNKIVMYNEFNPSDVHGVYSPAFSVPGTDEYESFEGMMLTDIIEHNGLMWLPAYTPAATRFSSGKVLGVLVLDIAFPRFNATAEDTVLYLPVKKGIYLDSDPGGGFGTIFGEDFGGPFGAEIKPYQYAQFISNDTLYIEYTDEDKALFRFKFDYFTQDDQQSTVYVMQDYTIDSGKVVITDSIPIEISS